MSASLPRLCVTIPCKGRLSHLQQSIPTWLSQQVTSFEWDVLVIDLACPDDTADWCRRQGNSRLRCLRFADCGAEFNLSQARNLGAKWSAADAVLWIDADILVPPDLLERMGRALFDRDAVIVHGGVSGDPISDGTGEQYTFSPCVEGICRPETVAVLRMARIDAWNGVRGFDEAFTGWGWEDVDFGNRLRDRFGPDREWFLPAAGLTFLNHGSADSVRFYAVKDKRQSADRNLALLQQRNRAVNSTGFGNSEPTEIIDFRTSALCQEWTRHYADAHGVAPYGSDITYQLAAQWLGGLSTVEDWGCGYAWARRYFSPPTKYVGVDWHGTPGRFADVICDLQNYQSSSEGILLRHVLEHNPDWRQIAANFLASFRSRGFLAFFIPPAETEINAYCEPTVQVPALQICRAELEALIPPDVTWSAETIKTGSAPLGVEVIYRLERKAPSLVRQELRLTQIPDLH